MFIHRRLVTGLARLAAALLLSAAAATVHATLLKFDELPWAPDPDYPWAPPALSPDTYARFGVTIQGAFLLTDWSDTVSPPQLLLMGNQNSIVFTGTLPRHVSLYITSTLPEGESWAEASGPNGYWSRAGTGGWPGGDAPHPIPYPEEPVPNSLVSFSSATGIARLDFFNAYQGRFAAYVDNMYFGAVPAVPEPAPLALAAAGLLCLAAAGFSARRPRPAGRGSGAARWGLRWS